MPSAILSISLSDDGLAVGLQRGAPGVASNPGPNVATASGPVIAADILIHPAVDQHSDTLLPAIEQLLQSSSCDLADLTGVAFDAGPGGFTRIRVACAVAQGIGLARSVPVAAIDSLAATALAAAMAHESAGPVRVLVAMDARMGECYVASFTLDLSDRNAPFVGERVPAGLIAGSALYSWLTQSSIQFGDGDTLVTGDAMQRYPDGTVPDGSISMPMPGAREQIVAVMTLARQSPNWVDAALAVPRYVRDKVALNLSEQAERRSAAG